MASISRPAASVLVVVAILLSVGLCGARPEPPDYISFFTSPTSIRVEWQEPSLDPGASVKGYRLQYKLGDSGKLVKLKLGVENSHDIEGLPEACGDYRIRMSTASSKGLSRYSSFSKVDRLPAAPENLAVVPTLSSSARINWDRPANSFCITGYRLKYGPDQSSLRTMELPELLNQYLLSDLQANISYVLSLEAVAEDGTGEEAFVQWFQAALPGVPANLRADPSSPEAALVVWSPAAGAEHYKFKYGTVETPDNKMMNSFVRSDSILLEDLEPGEEYRFILSAVNSVGKSDDIAVTWTQPSPVPVAPPKPKLAAPDWVRVEITSSSTATISWSPPAVEDSKLDIIGYIVGYGVHGTPEHELSLFSLSPEEFQSELDGLKPGSSYIAKVQAYNDVEDGQVQSIEWVQEAQLTIPTQVRGVLTYSSSPTSITVRWLLSDDVVIEQTEGFRVTYGQEQSADEYERVLAADADSVELAGLQPETFYFIKVYKFNAAGRSPAVTRSLETPGGFGARPAENILTEIPPPSNLEATVLSPTSARLTWFDETLIDGQVSDDRFYIVRYRSEEDPVNSKLSEVRTQETSFLADFLVPRVQFEFSVQLVLGPQRKSQPTDPITVTSRDPAQGAAPQRLTVLQIIITSPRTTRAVFNWLPPPERDDVVEYLLEYTEAEDFQDPDTIQQQVIADGSKMETIIKGLNPNTEYRARIKAIFTSNEQGPFSVPPALFTTPVIPPSSNAAKQCEETDLATVTRQIDFLWGEVAQRVPLFGVPIPYCDDIYGTEECHGQFCFCIPGKKPPALRNPECDINVLPCQREYEAARQALVEARESGSPAIAAQLPHCKPDGYYQPKQCSGTMCYCVTENGVFTGEEAPIWDASRLNCA